LFTGSIDIGGVAREGVCPGQWFCTKCGRTSDQADIPILKEAKAEYEKLQ
jgi:hypothetical protein